MIYDTEQIIKRVNDKVLRDISTVLGEQLSLIDSVDGYYELNAEQVERAEGTYWFEEDEILEKAWFQHGQLYIVIKNIHTGDFTTFEPDVTDDEDLDKLAYILYGLKVKLEDNEIWDE